MMTEISKNKPRRMPNGTGKLRRRFLTWNVGFGFGYAMDNHIDDIGFVRKLIEKLQDHLRIDSKKIFATGISSGGIPCHFLAGALSDKIAAIAPVVAAAETVRKWPSMSFSTRGTRGGRQKALGRRRSPEYDDFSRRHHVGLFQGPPQK